MNVGILVGIGVVWLYHLRNFNHCLCCTSRQLFRSGGA
jgi:hypothetical protein